MKQINVFTILVLGSLSPIGCFAQPERQMDQWNTEGEIKDLVVDPDGERIYVVGDFDYWTNSKYNASVLDGETFLPISGGDFLGGVVKDVLPDGMGGWYVGGRFDEVNFAPTNGFFHLDSDLNIIPGMPQVVGEVNVLVLRGDTLYLGGDFTSVGGLPRGGVAAILVDGGEVLDLSVHVHGAVRAVEVWNDTLFFGGDFNAINAFGKFGTRLDKFTGNVAGYIDCPDQPVTASTPDGNGGWFVAGEFLHVGDSARSKLAHIGADGRVTGWKCDIVWVQSTLNEIKTLEVFGDYLYVGGDFHNIGGMERHNAARVHVVTGEVDGWDPNIYGIPESFNLHESTLYVGGTNAMNTVGNWVTHGGIVDPDTEALLPDANKIDGAVRHSIPDDHGGFFITGPFTEIGDSIRLGLAQIDGNGQVTDFVFDIAYPLTLQINSMAYRGGVLYFGTNTSAQPLIACDTLGNQVFPDLSGLPDMTVKYLKTIGDTLFIGGSFEDSEGAWNKSIRAVSLPDFEPLPLAPLLGGDIRDIELIENSLYVAGDFDALNQAGYGAILNAETLQNTNTGLLTNGSVRVAAGDGQGGFFISGFFDQVTGTVCDGAFYLDADGNATCMGFEMNGAIFAMLVHGDTLFIGGDFTLFNGTARSRFAAWSISDGELLDWAPSFNSIVANFAQYGDTLFAGGYFTTVNGATRNRLAGLQLSTATLLPFAPSFNGDIYSLHVHEDALFVGGGFSNINAIGRNRLASFDLSSMVMTAWNPNPNGLIYDIESSGNQIFVCGTFSTIGGSTRQKFASFNFSTGSLNILSRPYGQSWEQVTDMAADGNTLLLGGYFDNATNGHFCAIDLQTNQVVDVPPANARVRCVGYSGESFFVGGDFTTFAGIQSTGLISLDVSTGAAEGFNPLIEGTVWQLESEGTTLYAAGLIYSANGTPVGKLGMFDHTTGDLITFAATTVLDMYELTWVTALHRAGDKLYIGLTSINQSPSYVPYLNYAFCLGLTDHNFIDFDPNAIGDISTISSSDGHVFIGGELLHLGGTKIRGFAAYDMDSGDYLPEQVNITANNVQRMAVREGILYLGGSGISIDGAETRSLAAYDLASQEQVVLFSGWGPVSTITDFEIFEDVLYFGGNNLGDAYEEVSGYDLNTGEFVPLNLDLNLPSNGKVYDIEIDASGLYVSHSFKSGPHNLQYVSAFDPSTGARIADWGIDATVASYPLMPTLNLQGDYLYIGGNSSLITNNKVGHLGSVSLISGEETNWKPKANHPVNALLALESGMFVGGAFTSGGLLGSEIDNYFVRLDPTSGAVLSSHYDVWIKGEVLDLAYDPTTEYIYVSGDFTEAGGSSRDYLLAISDETNLLVSAYEPGPLQLPVHMTFHNDTLWIQDYFQYAGTDTYYMRKVLPTGAFSADSIPFFGRNVRAMAFQGDEIFVGGDFYGVGGIPRNNILEIDAATGELTDFNPDIPLEVIVKAVVQDDVMVLLGKVNNKYQTLAINVNTYEFLPEHAYSHNSTDYTDRDLELADGEYFYYLNWFLGRREMATGASLTTPSTLPGLLGRNIEVSAGYLYLQGYGNSDDVFGRMDLETAQFVDFELELNAQFTNLAEMEGKVYVAGPFTEVNNMAIKDLVRIDGATGTVDDWTVGDLPVGIAATSVFATAASLYLGSSGLYPGSKMHRVSPVDGSVSDWSMDIRMKDVVEVGNRLYVAGDSPGSTGLSLHETFWAFQLDDCNTDVVCTEVTVYLDENGDANVDALDVDMGTVSDCAIDSLVLSQTLFTCDDIGENEVVLAAITGTSPAATCLTSVTVIDTIAPVFTAQDVEYTLPAGGSLALNPNDFVLSMFDNCSIDSVGVIGQMLFNCEDQGLSFEIEVVVVDVSGNSSTMPATVSIIGSESCCEADAVFAANGVSICAGETVAIPVFLSGVAPFQVVIASGNDTLIYVISDPEADSIYVSPTETTIYNLVMASDLLCEGSVSGTFNVDVEGMPVAGPDQTVGLCADGQDVVFSDYIHSDAGSEASFAGLSGGTAGVGLSGIYFLVVNGVECPSDTAEYAFNFTEAGTVENVSVFCDQPDPYHYEVGFEIAGGTPPFASDNGTFAGNVFTSSLISVLDDPEVEFVVSDLSGCILGVEASIDDSDGDGVCDEGEIVGCMDPSASNYDPLATDPGLCSMDPDDPTFELTGEIGGDDGIFGISQHDDFATGPESRWGVALFPNPGSAGGLVYAAFHAIQEETIVEIRVMDLAGRLIQAEEVKVEKGMSALSFVLDEGISPGIYLVSFVRQGVEVGERLVVN